MATPPLRAMLRCESPQRARRGAFKAERDENAPISVNFSSLSGETILLGVGVAAGTYTFHTVLVG